ncbi:quinon protein alcohol dehydrogenase-like superfamily [Schizophyllum amplum]|uniref:Quinon protein alcohol dehydrogenase-like superfamily n=1 Tax=Schizophyllum amplum TaxID=97359 RepID=A0A550CNS7_9AGAR|nr:quinon protein alcohol dehydrogenase-like superfamily [Auriculariopsis ampla]
MDFTEIYKHSSSLVAFSPGAHFILTAVQDRLVVRRADSFQITRKWQVDASPSPSEVALAAPKASASSVKPKTNVSGKDTPVHITHIAWSCDSEYVLAACAKSGVVHVYKLRDEEWSARIDAGAEGLVKAEWAPDGRNILCFSEWNLRVTIWSLVTGTSIYIQYPLHFDKGYAFRRDGRYLALVERLKSRDTLGLYDASNAFKLVRHFPLPTSSLSLMALSPRGTHIAICEGPLEYKLYIVSVATGAVLATFVPDLDPGFGIRHIKWHPDGAFLLVGGWDDRIHVLDGLSFSPICAIELASRVAASVAIWREPSKWLEATEGRGFLAYERVRSAQTLPVARPDLTKPPPKCGAVQMEFNQNGALLLLRFENVPNVMYIYDFPSDGAPLLQPKLRTVIMNNKAVLHARWNPIRPGNLAFCSGERSVYLWSDEWVGEDAQTDVEGVTECVGVPAQEFETRNLHWAPDGKGLVLLDKDAFCCAFEVQDEEV